MNLAMNLRICALIGSIAFSATMAGATDTVASKSIQYRGGVVVFSVPGNWKEEYKANGGATFYEERPDSGTLRLSVLSFQSKEQTSDEMALKAFPAGSYTLLANGFPLKYSVLDRTEGSERLHIHNWAVAVPVAPNALRLVLFHHTVLASQDKDPATRAEVDYLDRSIRAAKFSQTAGVTGPYLHK